MPRPEKEAVVQEIAEIFKNAKGVFINDFQGLNVEKMGELRQKCREASVEYRVVKNTLARLAAKEAGWEEMTDFLQGPSAIAFSYDDPSKPARVLTEFAKAEEKPKLKMSLFEGAFYGPDKVKEIAVLPSKDILLTKIVGGFNSPIQGFVGGLSGLIRKFVLTLNAVKESKEHSQT